ncbi:MAG: PIN domain-containing protein [Chloroflexi bacterium]|nr:PIN domain-containing protein [Chloroflexota bacterium]
MGVLIDTSLLIGREQRGRITGLIERPGVAISVITVSELLHGVHRATTEHRARREAIVEGILAGMKPVPITTAVARVHARIWSHLESRGSLIGPHDLWIASTALAHGYAVATLNRAEFERVPGLRLVDLPEPRRGHILHESPLD